MDLTEISKNLPHLLRDIRKSDRASSLAALGSLLMEPEIQSNALRIEGLIHLVDAYAEGSGKPTTSRVSSWFKEFGSFVGHLEDPAEDIFVGNVGTADGGYRLLEGLWEGNNFYTEIVLRAVEKIPADNIKEELLAPVHALLKLSDLLMERAGLDRYQQGNDHKQNHLPSVIAGSIFGNLRRSVLTGEELIDAGISKEQLTPFIKNKRVSLKTDFLADSELHRRPLFEVDEGVACAIPNAIGMAIRLFVIQSLTNWGLLHRFQQVICATYSEFFADQSLIDRPPEMPIGPMAEGIFSGGFISEFDVGRYLHFIPMIPSMEGIAEKGMLSVPGTNVALGEYIDQRCSEACDTVYKENGFVEIIHLVCVGGVGEGVNTRLTDQKIKQSRVVTIAAHDLRTLSDIQDFDLSEIVRVLDMRDQDRQQGIETVNINGFMNLVGWLRANDGFTLPPNIEDVELGDSSPFMLNFDSNMQRNLRLEAYSARDAHHALYVDGTQSLVWLYGKSIFPEDEDFPTYVEPVLRGSHGMRLLVKYGSKLLWAKSIVDEKLHPHLRVQKFEVIKTWLPRIARVLAKSPMAVEMPNCTLVEVEFETDPNLNQSDRPVGDAYDLTLEEIEKLPLEIKIDVDSGQTVHLNVPSSFDRKCFLQENVAEVTLVKAFVEALAKVSGYTLTDIEIREFVSKVVPNTQARQAHTFLVDSFRQSMVGRLPEIPKINVQDHARMTVSEAWEYRSKELGFSINGKEECRTFLNAATQGAIDKLIAELSVFDRKTLLKKVASYYEAINVNKTRWRLTASASVGLCKDQSAARNIIAQHEGELAGGLTGCRILLEAALFETKETGGREPGRIDIERLILRALHIFQLGGFSDGVHWDVIPPNVQISPQGQIQLDQSFNREVVETIALQVAKANIDQSIEDYGKQNIQSELEGQAPENLSDREKTFDSALKAEWGLDLDTTLIGLRLLEGEGVRKEQPVFSLKHEELIAVLGKELSPDDITSFIENFVFRQREKWQDIPDGKISEMFPWRFRRKSSVLRQPILEISASETKAYLVVPGLIAEAFKHQYGLMYEGAARVATLKTAEMKHWVEVEIGHYEALRFEKRMGERVQNQGYNVRTSVKLTEIFGNGLDKNYGDIDILAWDVGTGMVWVIECKNFNLRKTPGEMGEQLSNFRGEERDGKRDLLRKHLDRIQKLRTDGEKLSDFLGLDKVTDIKSVLLFPNPVPMQFSKTHCQGSDILLSNEVTEYFPSKQN